MPRCKQEPWDIHLWWATCTHSISIIHSCQVFYAAFYLFWQVCQLQELQNSLSTKLKCLAYYSPGILGDIVCDGICFTVLCNSVTSYHKWPIKQIYLTLNSSWKQLPQIPRKGSETLYSHSKEASTRTQICILLCTDIIMYHILADHLFALRWFSHYAFGKNTG